MATYKTPGVYVEEISTMPPSVAEVETAIPAFFGFTEFGEKNKSKRITSLLEYQSYFGGADVEKNISVTVSATQEILIDIINKSKNVLFYAMELYFANGGGPCFITSVGVFADNTEAITKDNYQAALKEIETEDEPTLLIFPDAPFSLAPDQYYSLMNDSIAQCTKLGDRFAVVDVLVADAIDVRKSIEAFRMAIAASDNVDMKYAAAYFPYLKTKINYVYDEASIKIAASDAFSDIKASAKKLKDDVNAAKILLDTANADVVANPDDNTKKRVALNLQRDFDKKEEKAKEAEALAVQSADSPVLNSILQNKVKQKLNEIGVELTPCAAIAAVYASVDNARGVWKAPANVSLNYVNSTTIKITDDDQNDMNIDVVDGKSVNALRPFIGKGIKVWGARTMDGNDNEWRYINIRRFFNMVEESIKKSTYWAVFEPNDRNTWVKVRAMIENYLILKWKDGALAGAKPDDAFFVRVGLGQTMTSQDVLEGKMVIEIGMAAVRPAEFIILKFSHKMQST